MYLNSLMLVKNKERSFRPLKLRQRTKLTNVC